MRISDSMINNMLSSNLLGSREALYEIQKKITSGKKVIHPSDDPTAYDFIVRAKNAESCLLQKIRNSESASLDLVTADATLENLTQILHRASELAVSAGDGTKTPSDRMAIGREINMLLGQLADISNSQSAGRFIFAGLRTNVAPYEFTYDIDGMITGVTYRGNTEVRKVEISNYIEGATSHTVDVNLPGSDPNGINAVFETESVNLFDSLIRLRDRLLAGENPVLQEEFTADAATDILTVNLDYPTGSAITVSSEGTLPGGLLANMTYYAIRVSGTEIQLAASYEDAILGNAIDITDAGAGTHHISPLHLEELNQCLDHVLVLRSEVGARLTRVQLNTQLLLEQRETNLAVLEEYEAADIAEASMILAQQQSAYEAAMRVIANTMRMSLVDYI